MLSAQRIGTSDAPQPRYFAVLLSPTSYLFAKTSLKVFRTAFKILRLVVTM